MRSKRTGVRPSSPWSTWIAAAWLMLALTACSSQSVPADAWAFLPAEGLLGADLEAAWLTEHGVVLQYEAAIDLEAPPLIVYALAPWETVESDGTSTPDAQPATESVALEPLTDAETELLREDAQPLQVLGELDWIVLRERMEDCLAPAEPGHSLVVRTDHRDEFLAFRDRDGEAFLCEVENRPDGVVIDGSLNPAQLYPHLHGVLDDYVEERGLSQRRGVIFTGAGSAERFPSIYFDLDTDRFVMHRVDRWGGIGGIGRSAARSADRSRRVLLQGHVLDVISRPVSNLYRFCFSLAHGTYDLIIPENLKRIGLSGPVPPVTDEPGMNLQKFEDRLDRITSTRGHPGTVRLLVDGDEFFPRVLDSMLDAKSRIDLRMFIFGTDDYAVKVADVMRRRSENIDVRILLDGLGTLMGSGTHRDVMTPGFVPPISIVKHLETDSDVSLRVRTPPLLYADHTKLFLIDRCVAFVGGMNIGQEYRYRWHDLMAELRGPVVDELDLRFRQAWVHSAWTGDFGYAFWRLFRGRLETEPREGDYPIRVLRTRSDSSEIYKAQVAAIKASRRSIVIENAYFADATILTELVRARRRGVDVRVILPIAGDHDIMNANNMVKANIMLGHGIRVFLYPGMSHVKAAIYDGWACLGTANFDKLSLRRNGELNIAYSHPPAVEELRQRLFEVDLKKSVEVTEPFDVGWSEKLARLIATQL